MNRRAFLKLLGLTAAGALLPGTPDTIPTVIAGVLHHVPRTDVGDIAFFQGMPVLFADGRPCCALPKKGNYELKGVIMVGQNPQACWVLT